MNKLELITKCQAWEEWGKSHPQKLPKTGQEAISKMRAALMFQPDIVSSEVIKDMRSQFNVSIDVTQEIPKEQFNEASAVVDMNILDYAATYLATIDNQLSDFEDLYKASLNLKLCTEAIEARSLKIGLDIQRETFKVKFLRSFAKEVGIELLNEVAVTRLRNKLSGEKELFRDFEDLAYVKIEKEYAIKLAAKTNPFSDSLHSECYLHLLKSNWLTAMDGFKNWCHYAIIKNHLAGFDDFLGYHIYRGRGGEGKTIEVKALKNWAIEGKINFYEGSSKDVRAGFMSRNVPDSLLSAIQEETGFDDEKANEVRKALGDIGGLIPTEQKFKDAETVISRTVCTSTTNDRKIYPQRKFLQVKFGRIDKNDVCKECLDNPQEYANKFVKGIIENIPVGEKYRPFYTALWQYLAKINETTLINDYWNSVLANWISRNHTTQLDHSDNNLAQGYVVEKKQSDGSFKDVTGEDKLIEIGLVKLTNELMGPQKDTQGDYFTRLSQCENFIKDFVTKNKEAMYIITASNGKQTVKLYPSKVYNILKRSWDETHSNDKNTEETKLLNYLQFIYAELRKLESGEETARSYRLDTNAFDRLVLG